MRPLLHHIDIITGELEQSIAFYCQTLGMKVAGWFYREDLFEFVFIRDRLGETNFSLEFCGPPLLDWQAQMLEQRGGCLDHLSFVADDIDQWHERLAALGTAFVQEPESVLGAREMYFKDPSGSVLEIITTEDPAITPTEMPSSKPLDGPNYRLRSATLVTDDLPQTASFYMTALNLETLDKGQDISSGHVRLTDHSVVAGGSTLPYLELKGPPGLSTAEQHLLDRSGPGFYALSFDVANIDLAHEELLSKGVDPEGGVVGKGGQNRLLFHDPNGILISVTERSR